MPPLDEETRLEQLLQRHRFDPSSMIAFDEFEADGFGPFVVKRERLMLQIIKEANPRQSVHISGCKGAGKTSLLRLIAAELSKSSDVYYFDNAFTLNEVDWENVVSKLIREGRKAYFIVDETQNVAACVPSALTKLLRNVSGHQITVVGAGVPEFKTMAASFSVKHTTNELFLSKEALQEEGIVGYFGATNKTCVILEHVRNHCGGHIFPLLRGMELLTKLNSYARMTTEEVIEYYESTHFRLSNEYKAICHRVLPPVSHEEILPLFHSTNPVGAFDALREKGFVSDGNKIISQLLLDAYFLILGPPTYQISDLRGGLEGIEQVLLRTLPGLQWNHYDASGGPIEDALTFELLTLMSRIPQLTTTLYNPKLVDVGTIGRRPDLFINSKVNSFIECILTEGNTKKEKERLDEHIGHFCEKADESKVRYKLLHAQDFAVLNYQMTGTVPLNPSDEFSDLFEERVYTFLMATRTIFRGNTRLYDERKDQSDDDTAKVT